MSGSVNDMEHGSASSATVSETLRLSTDTWKPLAVLSRDGDVFLAPDLAALLSMYGNLSITLSRQGSEVDMSVSWHVEPTTADEPSASLSVE